ncbi:MAG TPA: hypothetical protein VG167_18745 [Verrucomicrobiae bacterium]|nr:hypothetical protein [Verrucomicrobiae bacterium]
MKIVKKSISLPKDLFEFAEKKAAQSARESGEPKNVSSYLRRLIAKEREREEKQLQAA